MNSQVKKQTLSQPVIISAGLSLIADDGVAALSFRRLSQKLGVTPMALYRHFDNKQQLLAALLDGFIRQADVLPPAKQHQQLSWDLWLHHVASRMYRALLEQPSWLPLLGQLPLQNSGLSVLNACLQKLTAAGFSSQQSVEAFFAMLQVLFGAAIIQQQLSLPALLVEGEDFSEISKAAEALLVATKLQQIDLGMDLLIQGLKHQLASGS